jgi:adenine specific DNA methylase Mod
MNKLYFGDNLEIMKELLKQYPNGFIDLIYIDPPFNSKRNYNVLYESIDMEDTKAQKQAFADTWSNVSYLDTIEEIKDIDMNLSNFLEALDKINISKGAISYLATMGIRIWYMQKLMKDTGSFYLHCDPTMSHYLKIVCDLIFNEKNFKNEIVWCKNTTMYQSKTRFVPQHDIIFFYTKNENYYYNWEVVAEPFSEVTIKKYKYSDSKGRKFRLHGRNIKGSPIKNKTDINIKWLEKEPDLVRVDYLDKKIGIKPKDFWNLDILNQASHERLGYPTQKPEALLKKIIEASSNKGDVVADFFCGCGTAISVAQKLKRKWVGVDISHLAVKLITKRLMDAYGTGVRKTFEIFGFPRDIASARELATATRKGRLKFEEWIIEVMLHGVLNENKNQPGFDGYLTLDMPWKKEFVLIEVKSGNASLQQVNHFIQTIKDREAVMGLFVCFAGQVTDGMKQAAKKEGYYLEQNFGRKFEKLQIITVEDLLENKLPNLPPAENITFKKAATAKEENHEVELDL